MASLYPYIVAGVCLHKAPVACKIVSVRLDKGHFVPCQWHVTDRIRGAREYSGRMLCEVFLSVYASGPAVLEVVKGPHIHMLA